MEDRKLTGKSPVIDFGPSGLRQAVTDLVLLKVEVADKAVVKVGRFGGASRPIVTLTSAGEPVEILIGNLVPLCPGDKDPMRHFGMYFRLTEDPTFTLPHSPRVTTKEISLSLLYEQNDVPELIKAVGVGSSCRDNGYSRQICTLAVADPPTNP